MLDIWVLNAGKGDSIVIRYLTDNGEVFSVIDSNASSSSANPALKKLEELGAVRLSFLLLTHPHADHYRGLLDILDRYPVDTFYTYPFGLENTDKKRLKKLFNAYQAHTSNPNQKIATAALEFIKIMAFAKENFVPKGIWEELTGPENRIRPPNFDSSIEFKVILPLRKSKGEYFQMIDSGEAEVTSSQNLNDLSVAFSIDYAGYNIILGADGTVSSWRSHRKQLSTTNEKLLASSVKIPHHGSRADVPGDVVDYLYGDDDNKKAFISASGNKHHPSSEVLDNLAAKNIEPYCTNLSAYCSGRLSSADDLDKLDPHLKSFVSMNAEPRESGVSPICQGDIHISIDNNGNETVMPQYNNPCPYRASTNPLF